MKRRTRKNPLATARDLAAVGLADAGGGQLQVSIGGVVSPPLAMPGNVWSGIVDRVAGVHDISRTDILGSNLVNFHSFGAVGDGTTFNDAAWADAMDSGENLWIPGGNFRMENPGNGPTSSRRIIAQPGARIFSDVATTILNLQECSDVDIVDLVLETTVNDDDDTYAGVITATSVPLKRIRYIRGAILAKDRACNGVKIIADSLDALDVDDILFEGLVYRVGRMGFEIQDHTDDDDHTVRARNVRSQFSTFDHCGDLSEGIGLSFSGPMQGCGTDSDRFHGGETISIEFAREHQDCFVANPKFVNLGSNCRMLSMTNPSNDSYNVRASITGMKSIGRSGSGAYMAQVEDANLANNQLLTENVTMWVRDSRRIKAVNELYDTTGVIALYSENSDGKTCTDNDWDIKARTGSDAYAVVRFVGSGTTGNRVRGRIFKTSGVEADQQSGANGNELHGCDRPLGPYQPHVAMALPDSDIAIDLGDADTEAITFSGSLTATRTVTFPRARRIYTLKNTTAQSLTITVPSISTSTISITAGATKRVAINDTALAEV